MIDKIKSRYSCRKFTQEKVSKDDLSVILDCGRWAPSGLNNQPWRFIIVEEDKSLKEKLANCTHYSNIIKNAAVNIVVLLDLNHLYSKKKDILSVGGCIQNILLAAHELGYGTCWLGEILNQSDQVLNLFKLNPSDYELLAVIAIGKPAEPPKKNRSRKTIKDLILKTY